MLRMTDTQIIITMVLMLTACTILLTTTAILYHQSCMLFSASECEAELVRLEQRVAALRGQADE